MNVKAVIDVMVKLRNVLTPLEITLAPVYPGTKKMLQGNAKVIILDGQMYEDHLF